MGKIRILELESSKGFGGQEKRTVRLVNHLTDEFEVFFAVAEDSELYRRRNEINAEFFSVEIRKSYDLSAIWKLCKLVKKLGIHIISTHSGKDAWVGNIVGRLTGRKVVRTRHLLVPIKNPLSYNLSTKVVAISRAVYNYLAGKGVKKEKLELIYTGIDTERFKPRKVEKNSAFRIGVVAVLRAAKRHIFLLEAVKDLDVEVWIVGDGPQKQNIERYIQENNLQDKVKMLGFVERPEELIPTFDVVVLPSEHEALGTALLEAQACGVPVIGSNVGGISECILHGETGFLFEKDSLQDLRNKIKKFIKSPQLRKEMGERARKFVVENFSVEQMVRKTERLYRELVYGN